MTVHRWVMALTVGMVVSITVPQAWARPASQLVSTIAYTHAGNIWLMNATGGSRRVLTAAGGKGQVSFSRYTWSGDGKYLLMVRHSIDHGRPQHDQLQLYNSQGKFIRSLGIVPEVSAFSPGWALDSDQVAAVTDARFDRATGTGHYTVSAISVSATRRPLWHYRDSSGCDDNNFDPAETLYVGETGFAGLPLTLQWSTRRHLAFFSASLCDVTDVVDTRTGRLHRLMDPSLGTPIDEVQISPDGKSIVGHTTNQALAGGASAMRDQVLVAPLDNLDLPATIGAGELPAWSTDSRTVFFVRRKPGQVLHAAMADGLEVSFQTYHTSVWQAGIEGYPLRKVTTLDAYGTGPLHVLPGSRSLVFSVVDNDWNLWRHRQANGQYSAAQLQQYGPRTRIVRVDLGYSPVTLGMDAGRPAVHP